MKIFHVLQDIFFEKQGLMIPRFSPHDLTEHYRKELGTISMDRIIIATKYSEIVGYIERFKYFSEREYGEACVDLMAKVLEKYNIFPEKNTYLVPVPMHWSRYIMRGFDHTQYIVENLSKETAIPFKKILSTAWSPHQSKLSREKRLENKINRFRMKNHAILPETVILFDDVISSGATANECAKVLKKSGVKMVIGVFLASNF